jgi:hypothetical protein
MKSIWRIPSNFWGIMASKTTNKYSTNPRLQERLNLIVVVIAAVLIAIIPILFNRNFYFIDDTQSGSTGPWRYLGQKVLQGDFSILNPDTWAGGNWITDGQFGLFSPITWVIGLCSLLFESVWFYATLVKIFFIALVSIGTYKSARILNTPPYFAILVGIAAPFSGFSSYFDQAAWFSGLAMSAICINYFWLSKLAEKGKVSPSVPIVVALLGVAIGYVYIAILLLVISGAQLLAGVVNRSKVLVHLTTIVLVLMGSVALYLPAMLTSSVTSRSFEGFGNSPWFRPEINGLLTNFIPVTSHFIQNFGPSPMVVPVMYGSVLFALILFAKGKEIALAVRKNLDITFFLLFVIGLMFGPSQFEPLHWPLRFYPLFIIFALLLLAASVGKVEQLETSKSPRFFIGGAVVLAALAWDQIVLNPTLFASNFIFLALFLLFWRNIAKNPNPKYASKLAALGVAGFILVSVGQHYKSPYTPLPDYKLPENIKEYSSAAYFANVAEGRTIYINGWGAPENQHTILNTKILVGNAWFLTDKKVANGYNVAGYENFTTWMTENYRGDIGEYGLWRLLETQNVDGQPVLADLMQMDTIVALKNGSISFFPDAPTNWVRDDSNPEYVTYKRINKSQRLPFNVSSNATISDVKMMNDSITFNYSTTGDAPAEFIFPRLAWPGYKTSLGSLIPTSELSSPSGSVNPPTETFLLRMQAPPGKNLEVKVEYSPPAWNLSVSLLYLIVLLVVLSEVLFRVRSRKPKFERSSKLRFLGNFVKKN